MESDTHVFISLSLPSSEGKTAALENKNGKKLEKGGGPKQSMLAWFVLLALLGVWSSMAVLYLEIVDYDSVLGNCSLSLWGQNG